MNLFGRTDSDIYILLIVSIISINVGINVFIMYNYCNRLFILL